MRKRWAGVIVVFILFVGCLDSGSNEIIVDTAPPQGSYEPVKIAAFNIQVFGKTKASKPEVMDILAKTIRNFDIVAVQEIRDKSQTALPALVAEVNALGGPEYKYIVSDRLGRTTSKEQYAYLYNTETVELGQTEPYVYQDENDVFHREPYIASFKTKNGNFDFVLITIHTDPDEAPDEILNLRMAVDEAETYHYDGDFIILGDLNADCNYYDEERIQTDIPVGYILLIENDEDTTTKSTDCTYDRIIVSPGAQSDLGLDNGVFRFDLEYGLGQEQTEAVSDHYPVYAEFWVDRDED
jgi:endonuclease/exonuclease/phosphatase family metal-dependent hydrolase